MKKQLFFTALGLSVATLMAAVSSPVQAQIPQFFFDVTGPIITSDSVGSVTGSGNNVGGAAAVSQFKDVQGRVNAAGDGLTVESLSGIDSSLAPAAIALLTGADPSLVGQFAQILAGGDNSLAGSAGALAQAMLGVKKSDGTIDALKTVALVSAYNNYKDALINSKKDGFERYTLLTQPPKSLVMAQTIVGRLALAASGR